MRVSDFENAIVALNCNVELDEVKLRGGHVRQAFGHTDCLKVVWDELGRAFSMPSSQESEEFIIDTGQNVYGRRLQRDPEFDLKFE